MSVTTVPRAPGTRPKGPTSRLGNLVDRGSLAPTPARLATAFEPAHRAV